MSKVIDFEKIAERNYNIGFLTGFVFGFVFGFFFVFWFL